MKNPMIQMKLTKGGTDALNGMYYGLKVSGMDRLAFTLLHLYNFIEDAPARHPELEKSVEGIEWVLSDLLKRGEQLGIPFQSEMFEYITFEDLVDTSSPTTN